MQASLTPLDSSGTFAFRSPRITPLAAGGLSDLMHALSKVRVGFGAKRRSGRQAFLRFVLLHLQVR